jgi:hypothetical protein
MKKAVYFAAIVLMAIAGTACSKDKGGGNDNRYENDRYGYGGGRYGYGGNANRNNIYRWDGNVCIDTRYNEETNPRNCQRNQFGGNGFYGGNAFGPSFNSNICANSPGGYGFTGYPVYYPATGITSCMEVGIYQQIGAYGTPFNQGSFYSAGVRCVLLPNGLPVCY